MLHALATFAQLVLLGGFCAGAWAVVYFILAEWPLRGALLPH